MCQDNTECSSDGVAKICYQEPSFTNDSFFCDCASWYGFVGDDCDETSITLYYYRTTTILAAAIFLIFSGFAMRTLFLYVRLFNRSDKSTGEKIDPVFYLLLLILLSALLMCVQAAIRIPVLFDSTMYKVVIQQSLFFDDKDDVVSNTGTISNQLLVAGSSVIFLAELQIVLSWLKVLISYSQTFPEAYGCIPIERLAKIMRYLLPALLLTVGVLAGISVYSETALFYVLLVLVSSVGYTYGYFKFIRVLKRLPKGDVAKMKVIGLVKTTYQINMIGNIGVFASSGLYYVFVVNYINVVEPGTFNHVLVFYDLAVVSAALLVGNLSWYSHIVTVRLLNIEKSNPWLPKIGAKSKMSLGFIKTTPSKSSKIGKKESLTAIDSSDVVDSA